MNHQTFIHTYRDGSQVMVTVWADETAELAHRRNQHAVWGVPLQMVTADHAEGASA